jgi:eukaryotic-like serine/threonine-protein kinase
MSSDGGAPHGQVEPTSFHLPPPQPVGGRPEGDGPPPAYLRTPSQGPGAGRLIGGRYRLLKRIGHGGMGTVWRARDETVDREVAVKEPRVPEHLTDSERDKVFERMRREARAAARLDHPAVVNVHDVAVEEGRPWIVMEFVQGRSLGDVLREGTLEPAEAARIGLQVLGALQAAHDAGVLHRDVKPDNVLLGRYDRVVLTDFGIARIEGETSLTESGGFVGSPEFIAPERILGRRPGPASDLWSLGVVLYAATEGVSPFRRSNAPATLQSVLNAVPAPLVSAKGPLAEAINGLLAKDPAARPDAARVRRLLEEAAVPPLPADTVTARLTAPAGGSGGGRPAGTVVGGTGTGSRFRGAKVWLGAGAAVVAAAVAAVLLVNGGVAGSSQDGGDWTTHNLAALGAKVAAPQWYEESRPTRQMSAYQHWVAFTDPSGAISVRLTLIRKTDSGFSQLGASSTAEAYADIGSAERGSSLMNALSLDKVVRQKTTKTTYEGRESAENSIVYTTGTVNEPMTREARIFYYRTKAGEMYKLWIDYPGKGDFTARGREVAATAIDRLRIDTL